MDGRSAGLLEQDKTQVSNPKKSLFYSSFSPQNSLKTFRKCKKHKDRWAKPFSFVHIGGTWKIILVQVSTMAVQF